MPEHFLPLRNMPITGLGSGVLLHHLLEPGPGRFHGTLHGNARGAQVGDNESFLRNLGFSSTVLVLPGVFVTGGHRLSPVWRSQTRTASYELPFKTKTSHRTAISLGCGAISLVCGGLLRNKAFQKQNTSRNIRGKEFLSGS